MLFGHRLIARRESGVLEFYYRRISAVKQCKLLRGSQFEKKNFFFEFSRVSPGAHSLTKNPEDFEYEIEHNKAKGKHNNLETKV